MGLFHLFYFRGLCSFWRHKTEGSILHPHYLNFDCSGIAHCCEKLYIYYFWNKFSFTNPYW
jgi:hypothetical protein